jgi:hypothetical protein
LDDLEKRLRPIGEKDRETLLKLKKEDHEKRGLPFDNEFYLWDYRYYDRLFVEKTLSLDDSLVKEYFPVDVVVPAILDIYQNLLGVKFYDMQGLTWHPGGCPNLSAGDVPHSWQTFSSSLFGKPAPQTLLDLWDIAIWIFIPEVWFCVHLSGCSSHYDRGEVLSCRRLAAPRGI